MAKEIQPIQDGMRGHGPAILHVFPQLTSKQREVLAFIAENRTSKEIAWELGISESAVNQRIEGVRTRVGSPPRAELARAYRQYLQDMEAAGNPMPDTPSQVRGSSPDRVRSGRNGRTQEFDLVDAVTDPQQREASDSIVPKMLDGENAGLSRTAAMIAIAGGILLVAMVGLGVVRALSYLI